MIIDCECHGTGQIKSDLGRQTRALLFDLASIGEPAQLFHQRLLLSGQTALLGLAALFCVFRIFHAVGGSADIFQPGNGMPQATDFKVEVAFRQFRQRLAPVVQQTHGKIRPARQRRSQRQAEAQAEQMTRPVTGEHSKLLGQYSRSAPNRWRVALRPLFDRHASG
ncbi:hypothetical protein D3C84_586260 [compost metagenome]